jgi:hypothetical protein
MEKIVHYGFLLVYEIFNDQISIKTNIS